MSDKYSCDYEYPEEDGSEFFVIKHNDKAVLRIPISSGEMIKFESITQLCKEATDYNAECEVSRGRTYQDYVSNCGYKFGSDDIVYCPLCGGLLTYE